jgi:hypothetical protein
MRNFSTMVDLSNSFAIGVDEDVAGIYFYECLRALTVTMDANPSFLSPSQEAVLLDFNEWFERAKDDDRNGRYPQKPVFFYVNLNMGHSVAFVAVNSKGKLDLSAP